MSCKTFHPRFPKVAAAVSSWTPFACVVFVALICGSIAAANAGIASSIPGARLLLAIFALHCSGFIFGYLVSRLFGADEAKARTISIETGTVFVIIEFV